jgi:hypothetical protein
MRAERAEEEPDYEVKRRRCGPGWPEEKPDQKCVPWWTLESDHKHEVERRSMR